MRMRKAITLLICFIMVFTLMFGAMTTQVSALTEPRIAGTGAMVYCATTDEILWSVKPDTKYNPASMTKLLTCLVALEEMTPETMVTVAYEATQTTKYESMVFDGEQIALGELIYQTLMISANDSAKAIAIAVAGSEEEFAKKMNEKAASIGCTKSKFRNASGLAANGNKTTAHDMILIAVEAMKNDYIRKVVGTTKHTIPKTNKTEEKKIETGNLLLTGGETDTAMGRITVDKYAGLIGGKTGTTDENKATMVVGCEMQGLEIYVVTLNSTLTQRYRDITNMLNWARDTINPYEVFPAGTVFEETKIRGGATNRVSGMATDSVVVNLPEGASASLITTEEVYNEKLLAPIEQGQEIGTLNVLLAGVIIRTVPLVASESIKKGWFLSGLGITNSQTMIIIGVLLVLIAAWLVIMKIRSDNIKKRNKARQERIRQMAIEEMKKQEDWEKRGWTYHDK